MRDLEENSGALSMKHSIQRYIGSMNQPDFVLKDSEDGLVRKVLRSIGYAMMEQTNGYLVVRNKSIYSGHRPSRMSKRPMLYRRI